MVTARVSVSSRYHVSDAEEILVSRQAVRRGLGFAVIRLRLGRACRLCCEHRGRRPATRGRTTPGKRAPRRRSCYCGPDCDMLVERRASPLALGWTMTMSIGHTLIERPRP